MDVFDQIINFEIISFTSSTELEAQFQNLEFAAAAVKPEVLALAQCDDDNVGVTWKTQDCVCTGGIFALSERTRWQLSYCMYRNAWLS